MQLTAQLARCGMQIGQARVLFGLLLLTRVDGVQLHQKGRRLVLHTRDRGLHPAARFGIVADLQIGLDQGLGSGTQSGQAQRVGGMADPGCHPGGQIESDTRLPGQAQKLPTRRIDLQHPA